VLRVTDFLTDTLLHYEGMTWISQRLLVSPRAVAVVMRISSLHAIERFLHNMYLTIAVR
jgi:hypothetical protein